MWQPTCYLVLKNGAWRPAMTWLADYVYRATGIDAGIPGNPPAVSLEQNYPNPVSTATEIRFTLSQPQKVTLTIFDNLGREVITLVDETLNSGHYSIPWIVRNHSDRKIESGIYYYRLTAGSTLLSRKMLVLK